MADSSPPELPSKSALPEGSAAPKRVHSYGRLTTALAVLALATASDSIRQNLWLGEVAVGRYTLHPLVALFAISGSLMISRIRIPKI